jgi:hypothetical protein
MDIVVALARHPCDRRDPVTLFFFTSTAFAFGESLFFEWLQRKVTAPPRNTLALMPGAPPRAWTSSFVGLLQTLSPLASHFSLMAPKEK